MDLEVSLKKRIHDKFTVSWGTVDGMKLRKLVITARDKNFKTKVQKMSFGVPSPHRPSKVIMLVGATGAGKTTLINAMVNYIFRVKFNDEFRLVLVDDKNLPKRNESESQTDLITAYIFNHMPGMPFDYNCVLIDTPGFGDTRGIQRDREMLLQLDTFLEKNDIDQVDVIGFVTPSSAARLTQSQKYIFDGLSSMFAKNIKNNIFIMATFADAKKAPVLTALKAAGVHYSGFYKFNNSAIYSNNKDLIGAANSCSEEDDDDDGVLEMCRIFWEIGYKSLENFFSKLNKITPASLALTKEVLEQRIKLQTVMVELQSQVHLGLSKLANLEEERDVMSKIRNDIEGCRKFEMFVDVPRVRKINLRKWETVTNCTTCSMTCHYPCSRKHNTDKRYCSVMRYGFCNVCPGKCSWVVHFNMEFRFETVQYKERRIVQKLLDGYNMAQRNELNQRHIIRKAEDDINKFGQHLIAVLKSAQLHLEKLDEISLKSNPLSTKEYIDLLIESEKMEKRCDFQKRIDMLELIKDEVRLMAGVPGAPAVTHFGTQHLLNYFKNLFTG